MTDHLEFDKELKSFSLVKFSIVTRRKQKREVSLLDVKQYDSGNLVIA